MDTPLLYKSFNRRLDNIVRVVERTSNPKDIIQYVISALKEYKVNLLLRMLSTGGLRDTSEDRRRYFGAFDELIKITREKIAQENKLRSLRDLELIKYQQYESILKQITEQYNSNIQALMRKYGLSSKEMETLKSVAERYVTIEYIMEHAIDIACLGLQDGLIDFAAFKKYVINHMGMVKALATLEAYIS